MTHEDEEEDGWAAVDAFTVAALGGGDPDAGRALAASAAAGLPEIAVSPAQGRWLQLTARMIGARRILEVGTLGGYSTIWLAKALPEDGALVTLELEPRHAEVARANLKAAGLDGRAQVRVGPAAESLAALAAEGAAPFDLAFLDADKASYPVYLRLVLPMMQAGGVIVADNVVREGRILGRSRDANAEGARAFIEAVGREPRLSATVIQTVGDKGWDGMLVAVVG